MIYKNNLSKLAMLLLAGAMTFVTSCSDDETTGNSDGNTKQGGGDESGSGDEDQEDLEFVPGISITKLQENKDKILGNIQTAVETINKKSETDRTPAETAKKTTLDALSAAATAIELDEQKIENNVDDALALLAIYVRFLNVTGDNTEDTTDSSKKTRENILATVAKVVNDVKHYKGKPRKGDFFQLSKKTGERESKTKFKVSQGTGKEVVDTLMNNTVFNVEINGLKSNQTFTIDEKSFGGFEVVCKK